ncbi:MAG: hypothetical protein NTW79_01150 [Candidatus Berkelbacteria bacterium]|nr:hypothetical protein [Candidatus Berkelbacteria bacterium]
MKRIISILVISAMLVIFLPTSTLAAGGVYATGGGAKTVGDSFTVTVAASGATFNALEGTISVSGPVSITSFSAGGATWTSVPANGTHFVGMIIPATTSLTVATIRLKAAGVGSGAVSISSVRLANAGSEVGSGAGSASFSIAKAPQLASVTVTSSSHPDQATAYDTTTIALAWNKASGVDGFSYLLDQAAATTPAAKIIDAATSATHANKAIGIYYFHIRAHNTDGWGPTTHFEIQIKAPDAKVDTTLPQPTNIKIEKSDNFVNDIEKGTISGLKISGVTVPAYTAKITLTPVVTIPDGKVLTAVAGDDGSFEILIDWAIPAGRYSLTVQGQKDLSLTPVSDPTIFEISQAKGGAINILTDADSNPPTISSAVKSATRNWKLISEIAGGVLILFLIGLLIYLRRRKSRRTI